MSSHVKKAALEDSAITKRAHCSIDFVKKVFIFTDPTKRNTKNPSWSIDRENELKSPSQA